MIKTTPFEMVFIIRDNMKHRQFWVGSAAFCGILAIILDGKTAMEGAQTGISLCLKTVIPSLFPFFVLSCLLTNSLAGTSIGILRPIQKLCSLGTGTESILICAFLGGYPVGAQSVASLWRTGQISRQEAERLLSFCNNAGPAFLFGMVGSLFPGKWTAASLWGIHIVSALLTAKCFPGSRQPITNPKENPKSFTDTIKTSLHVMGTVCGWVVLFRILIGFLNRWILWLFPAELQTLVVGLLELSNGCCDLAMVPDERIRYLLCCGMLAMGGLCVTMQTMAVTNGLSLRKYFLGKLLQTGIGLLLSLCVISGLWYCGILAVTGFLLIPVKKKNSSSIPQPVGV